MKIINPPKNPPGRFRMLKLLLLLVVSLAAGVSFAQQPPNPTCFEFLNSFTLTPTTCGSMDVSWGTVSNASYYELIVANNSNFNNATTYNVNGTLKSLTGLTPGGDYYVKMNVWKISNCSSPQAQLIENITLPTSPQNVTTSDLTCTSVAVEWDPVPGITDYYIQWEHNGNIVASDAVHGSSYVITGLNPNTQYSFHVTTTVSGWPMNTTCSYTSTPQNFTTLQAPPVANIWASNTNCTGFTLNWSPMFGVNTIYVDIATNASFTNFVPGYQNKAVNPMPNSLSIDKLFGKNYYYRVRTENANLCVSHSGEVGITLPNHPQVPNTLTAAAKDVTCNSFRAEWAPSSGAVGYLVDVSTHPHPDFDQHILSAYKDVYVNGYSNVHLDVTGLTTNVEYYYRVMAINSTGCKSHESGIIPVTPVYPDAPVVNIPNNQLWCTQATLNWGTVDNFSSYEFKVKQNGTIVASGTRYKSVGTDLVTATITGLVPNTNYTYEVTAYSSPTCSGATTTGSFATQSIPGVPTNPNAKRIGCNKVRLSWAHPLGSAPGHLVISLQADYSAPLFDGIVSGNTYDLNDVPLDQTIYWKVKILAPGGCNGTTYLQSSFNMIPTPAPTDVSVTQIMCGSAMVTWNYQWYDQGAGLPYPRGWVQVAEDPDFSSIIFDYLVNSAYHGVGIPNLHGGQTYYVRLAADQFGGCPGDFEEFGSFTTADPDAIIDPAGLYLKDGIYETCTPIENKIGGTSTCTDRWYVEIQYYSDETYSTRSNPNDPAYEWIGPEVSGSVPLAFDNDGLTAYILNNGGDVYPANNIFEPNGYYKVILHTGSFHAGANSWTLERELKLHICHFTLGDNIEKCEGEEIIAKASIATGPFQMQVRRCDMNGAPLGAPSPWQHIDQADLDNGFDIIPFFSMFTFTPNNYYKVTLTSPFGTTYKIIFINPAVSVFTLNGQSTATVEACLDEEITLDGSESSCHLDQFLLELIECNSAGNHAPGASWFGGPVNSTLVDVKDHAITHGNPLQYGKYYKVKWSVGTVQVYTEKILYVRPETPLAHAGYDVVMCSNSIPMNANAVTYGIGSWSIVSGGGGAYFSNTNSPTATFYKGSSTTYVLRWTITTPCGANYTDITVHAGPVVYANGNEAYWTERCAGYKPVCVNGNGFWWDADLEQYVTMSSTGEQGVLLPYKWAAGQYVIQGGFRWDNQTLAGPSQWDDDHLFVYYGLGQGVTNNMASWLDLNSTGNAYNIVSTSYPSGSGIPGAASYNISTNPAIINPGNVDNGSTNDYLYQQDVEESYCANYHGKGWRLPTKNEIGFNDELSNSQGVQVDPAYAEYSLSSAYVTSSVTDASGTSVWGVQIGAVTGFDAIAINPLNVPIINGFCVFNTHRSCSGNKKGEEGYDPRNVLSGADNLGINDGVSDNKPVKDRVSIPQIKVEFMPNPTYNNVMFSCSTKGSFSYELIDMQGRSLQQGKITDGDLINLESYAQGIYMVRVLNTEGGLLSSTRVVKK